MSIEAIKEALDSMCRAASMHDSEWTHRMGEVNDWGTQCWEIDGERVQELATAYGETTAAFIASCNPVAIRSLIERLEAAEQDAARLDLLDSFGYSYGFQDMHEGNAWEIRGPFKSVRDAIDSYSRGLAKGVNK